MVSAAFETAFAQVPGPDMHAQWDQVTSTLEDRFPRAGDLMVGSKEEVLAFTAFPSEHWRQIWSANPLERLNKELKRRCRVVGTYPNEASVIRLGGAVLLDVHDEWWLPNGGTSRRPLWPSSTPLDNHRVATSELTPAGWSSPRIACSVPTSRRDATFGCDAPVLGQCRYGLIRTPLGGVMAHAGSDQSETGRSVRVRHAQQGCPAATHPRRSVPLGQERQAEDDGRIGYSAAERPLATPEHRATGLYQGRS